jgi:uncharacterized iron-regulated membrane protein
MAAFMVKSLLMQFHRWLGVALGLILGIVAITGAIMSLKTKSPAPLTARYSRLAPRPRPTCPGPNGRARRGRYRTSC